MPNENAFPFVHIPPTPEEQYGDDPEPYSPPAPIIPPAPPWNPGAPTVAPSAAFTNWVSGYTVSAGVPVFTTNASSTVYDQTQNIDPLNYQFTVTNEMLEKLALTKRKLRGQKMTPTKYRCNNCGDYMTEDRPLCEFCMKCSFCRQKPAKPDSRCEDCRCTFCGNIKHVLYSFEKDGNLTMTCRKCGLKNKVLNLCIDCTEETPSAFRKGDKKPSICGNCAVRTGRAGPRRRTHRCFFCTEKAVTLSGNWLACKKCSAIMCHQTAECNPLTQCASCKERNEIREKEHKRAVQKGRKANIDTTKANHYRYAKQGPNGTCMICAHLKQGNTQVHELYVPSNEPLKFWTSTYAQHKTNRQRRHIGVEIEVSSLQNPHTIADLLETCFKWDAAIVRDGSLPITGFEITTSPANGDLFLQQVTEITDRLHELEARANEQCGLHVHIDARDFSYDDIRRFLLLYTHLEDELIATQPAKRIQGKYCKPVGKLYIQHLAELNEMMTNPGKAKSMADIYKQTLKNKVINANYTPIDPIHHPAHAQNYQQPPTDHYNHARYRALNIHSWWAHGTIEFRMHSGTIVGKKIINWASLCAAIVETALKMSDREMNRVISSTRPDDLLRSIAPSEAVRTYFAARQAANKKENF